MPPEPVTAFSRGTQVTTPQPAPGGRGLGIFSWGERNSEGAQATMNTVTANMGKERQQPWNFEMVRVIEKGSYRIRLQPQSSHGTESVIRRLLPCNNQLGVAGENVLKAPGIGHFLRRCHWANCPST